MPTTSRLRLRIRPGRCGPTPQAFYDARPRLMSEGWPNGRPVCSGIARHTGVRCKRIAAYGTPWCQWHGARDVLRKLGLLRQVSRISVKQATRLARQGK